MTVTNTDFVVQPGNTIESVIVGIIGVTKYTPQHAAEQNLSPVGPLQAGTSNNVGGRFGWVSFGKTIATVPSFEEKKDISYFNHYFASNMPECDTVRVWLQPGVKAEVMVNAVSNTILEMRKALGVVEAIASHKGAGELH